MKKIILLIVVVSLVAGVLFWLISMSSSKRAEDKNKPIELTVWGFDEEEIVRSAILAYQSTHPSLTIKYVKQSLFNYRTRVQTQIRAGQGPDVLAIHSSWLPMVMDDLSPAPLDIFSFSDYGKAFYPVARDNLTSKSVVYAVPQELDGIVLYVNDDILLAANVASPRSWQEFIDSARKVTVKNQLGQIQTSGAALGATNNVDYWPEIIATLFYQQPSGNLETPANINGAEVLQFYTSFVIDPKNKTWDTTLPFSTQMFENGQLAFYFAPYRKALEIKAANPNLKFHTVMVPQLPGKQAALGTFWANAVSGRSLHTRQSWEFVKYLSSPDALALISQKQAEIKGLPKISPRTDSVSLQADPVAGAFLLQGPYYKGWYLNSDIQDAGINEEMIAYYAGAVNGVLQGQDALGLLQTTQSQVKEALDKYKVTSNK